MMRSFLFTILMTLIISCNLQRKDTDDKLQVEAHKNFNSKINAYIAVNNFYVSEYKGSSWQENLEDFYKHYGTPKNVNLSHEGTKLWQYQWGVKMAVKPALEEIDKKPNLAKLDSLQFTLCNQILKTSQIFDEFNEYYNTKEFLQDNYTKANEIYERIITNLEKTDSLYQNTNNELSHWIDKRDTYYLAQIKDKEPLNYHLKYSLIKSKELLNEIEKQNISNKNIIDLSLTSLISIIDEIKSSNKELSSLVNDEKEITKSNISTYSTLKRYKSQLEQLIGHINLLVSKVDEKEGFSENDLEYMQGKSLNNLNAVDGSINAIRNTLNEMIDAFNYIM